MSPLEQLVHRGGFPLIAILVLSLLLYYRCAMAVLYFWQVQRRLQALSGCTEDTARLRRLEQELARTYDGHRVVIGTMIAAGPLLGLFGTVSGMITTFEGLAQQAAQKTVEGLAGGISEALISTEAGLAVAIPAVLALYYAHRLSQKGTARLRTLQSLAIGGTAT